MKELVLKSADAFRRMQDPRGHRFAVIEGNRDCNRRCSYCAVPIHYKREQEATLAEACQTIDWLYNEGYRLISYLGGEPLAPFRTKEGISFFEHTASIVEYAGRKGMLVNVTTNGDFATEDKISELRKVGLDSLTFSLHTYKAPALSHIIKSARWAAQAGIVPAVQTVLTTITADNLPAIAATVAENGILFSFGIVQQKGGEFSIAQQNGSIIPSEKQQGDVLRILLSLKAFGFVRNSKSYLTKAGNFYPNNWKCDPERDTFIHIGAGGKVNVCSDVRTNLTTADIHTLDNALWREIKKERVAKCGNCLYHCYYEAQNPDIAGDISTAGVALLIKAGKAKTVERWGRFAVGTLKRRQPEINWNIQWNK